MSRDFIQNYDYMVWPHLEDEHTVTRAPYKNVEEDCMVAALDAKRRKEGRMKKKSGKKKPGC